MPASDIVIKGAREHNLRDIDLILPRNRLICFTGVSGSGKSSLAFDTLYAEGQRRYIESLSSYARQFLGQLPKPDVDLIGGMSPSISISQKSAGSNPRSTVGTMTEIYDFLRVLYARVGTAHCPECNCPITAQTRDQIIAAIQGTPAGATLMLLAPVVRAQKGEHRDLLADFRKQGFARARVDGRIVALTDDPKLDRRHRHNIDIVVDRIVARGNYRVRLAEAIELATRIGQGTVLVSTNTRQAAADPDADDPSTINGTNTPDGDLVFSLHYGCPHCGIGFTPPTPQLFSFNSPQGMCLDCDGLGSSNTFDLDRLIPDRKRSMRDGCIELIGSWKTISRWRRHVYQGVADTIERVRNLPEGTLIDTPWEDLPSELQRIWTHGTGDQHITFTWRGGHSPIKYGGKFAGIIPDLMDRYRGAKSRVLLSRLEPYMRFMTCPGCDGARINRQARHVFLASHDGTAGSKCVSLPELCQRSVAETDRFLENLELDATRQIIANDLLKEIHGRLAFLLNVGLDYLSLDRTAPTLSGGESQRIRLASQIGCGLVGVLYILDEPSIGLHPRDNERLLSTLEQLRDIGNTVIVVEHDEETIRRSDHIVDFGPGAGVRGGHVVGCGSVAAIARAEASVTGQYLSGKRSIGTPSTRRPPGDATLRIVGAAHNNLRNIDVDLPIGRFVCVTGVSGSGKSSLVNDILIEALRRDLNRGEGTPGNFVRLEGLECLDKMIAIDQSPIGRTPRSNPGTYIKVFDEIRRLFARLPDSRRRGYQAGRFSFNVDGGRCSACDGNGSNRLEMDFLADIWVTCPVCEGHRFNRETLSIRFHDRSVADVLEMDVQEALELFANVPAIAHKLQTLHDVGLDYLKLGQASPTLSGGEAQRIKLARELVKKSTGRTIYLLDEPTTGLHFADIQLLLNVLHSFVEAGNTVVVVEHNLDVIKTADWVLDLGPEGGAAGGQIVAAGTPEEVARCTASHTGRALRSVLGMDPKVAADRSRRSKSAPAHRGSTNLVAPHMAKSIDVDHASQHNLKDVSLRIPRDQMTVFCGPSGSGKSSLAIDTIYAEGQRRYVESLSAYARQFVGQMQKPRVERIEGLSPAIALEQQNLGHTPRSTVGTTTEIHDYLRVLFARLGTPHCPDCDQPVGTQSVDEIIEKVASLPSGTRAYLLAPIAIDVGDDPAHVWEELRSAGYRRVRVDGTTWELDAMPSVDRRRRHSVQAVIDRIEIRKSTRSRLAESIEAALTLGKGVLHVVTVVDSRPEPEWPLCVHSQHLACGRCGRSFDRLTPHNFSFNSPLGWCPQCDGLGSQTGTDPSALFAGTDRTLADGAMTLWPELDRTVSQAMLAALASRTGLPLDVPLQQLPARFRRLLLHGAGEKWFDVFPKSASKKKDPGHPLFRFQFKGLYPAIEEASRLSPTLRMRLAHMTGEVECGVCAGSRLRDDAGAVRFRHLTIDELCRLTLGQLNQEVRKWKLTERERAIAGELIREIKSRVAFLNDVGLEYLTLHRSAATLSGGESQRIRLASQLGSGLCGVLYVLDEPTIGLHPRDNQRLLAALHRLRDLGNTLVLVEHDREILLGSDHLVDFGPAAGLRGGEIVASGTPAELGHRRRSVTGPYLAQRKAIPVPANRRTIVTDLARPPKKGRGSEVPLPVTEWLTIAGARHHNLKDIDVRIPLGKLVAVTGPSGSGKSSLVDDILYNALASRLHRSLATPGNHREIVGIEYINKVIRVDQQPLGNSPASNPATYTGVFDLIRELFARLPDAKVRGYTPRRFSFNVTGGRCDACEGNGQRCIEMHFLPDVWLTCEECQGTRYNAETLHVKYKGHSIADILGLSCQAALEVFDQIPKVRRILRTLVDVGLDYLTLGQPAPTLSGGEAQRVKLAAELARPDTGRTIYLLDEPTTGLHFQDLAKLLDVLHRLVDLGNTVVVIEHNLDVIKSADWVVDLGPEAGPAGGYIVAEGTPEAIVNGIGNRSRRPAAAAADRNRSYTAEALRPVLQAGPVEPRAIFRPELLDPPQPGDIKLEEFGAQEKMPWEKDGPEWHTRGRVGRTGIPCKWSGRILQEVVRRIEDTGSFAPTNWQARTIVEINGLDRTSGWFFHAITGETWLLKLKFRVARGSFRREELIRDLDLKPLNQLDELPVYGNEPRVKCQNLRGPWQEVEIRMHSWEEANTKPFWSFLDRAIEGFQRIHQRATINPDDLMPWKKLGRRWHFSRKGFPPGRRVEWEPEILEELCDLLHEKAPEGQFLWNNQQVVHLYLKQQSDPWASIYTKRLTDVDLVLSSAKGTIALGRVESLGRMREIDTGPASRDLIKLKFRTSDDLARGDLSQFLDELLETAAV